MKNNIARVRRLVSRAPIIGYILRYISTIIYLPRRIADLNHASISNLHAVDQINKNQQNTNLRLIELIDSYNSMSKTLHIQSENIESIRSQFYSLGTKSKSKLSSSRSIKSSELFVDNHQLDDFYIKFENKFRGDELMIQERLKVYIPYLKKIVKDTKKLPLVDIGCGRGEFLEVVKQANIGLKTIGIDLNHEMVKEAKSKGYKAEETDALKYLDESKNNSLSGVCGFHIVEHIPFELLMNLFTNCFRAVKKGGVVIFETPNPENLTVGSLNFNYDPSHLKPLPPQLLAFCLEYVGFNNVEILPLHPEVENIENSNELTKSALVKLFGPRDYAVIAFK